MRLQSAALAKLLAVLSFAALLSSCGASARPDASTVPRSLLLQSRPIGHGAGFQLSAMGPVLGPCRAGRGPRAGVHIEVFAENRVVLVPAGIGTRPPLRFSSGRISRASCYGDLITLEPTGVVLVRRGRRLPLGAVFRSWGQPLTGTRVAAFSARPGDRVTVYVDGRRWLGAPRDVPLGRHTEIVLEVGPHVPPHRSYTFPPGS